MLLLDADQLRVMHDSEGVRSGFYDVGLVDVGMALRTVGAMVYLARAPYFVSPTLGRPLAFSAVHATARSLPAFSTMAMLAHTLESTGLIDEVADRVAPGASDPLEVAGELMRYLNGQWWFRRHTGLPGLGALTALHRRIDEVLLTHSASPTDDRGLLRLDAEEAYRADPARTLSGPS